MQQSRQYGDLINKQRFCTPIPYSATCSSYTLTLNTNPLFYTSSNPLAAKDVFLTTHNKFIHEYEFNPESLFSTSAVTKELSNLAFTANSSIKKGKEKKKKKVCIKSPRLHPNHNEFSEVEPNIKHNVRQNAASSHGRNDSVKSLTPLRQYEEQQQPEEHEPYCPLFKTKQNCTIGCSDTIHSIGNSEKKLHKSLCPVSVEYLVDKYFET